MEKSEQSIPGFSLRWSQVNRAIWIALKDPIQKLDEKADYEILDLVKKHGPLNRFELTALCTRTLVSKQDVVTLITNARRRLLFQGCIRIISPHEFCREFEQIGPGICFHPDGGYTIRDEYNNPYGNWRTADEAFLAHDKYYSHISLNKEQATEAQKFLTEYHTDTGDDTLVRD
jgi:hypothetical protein